MIFLVFILASIIGLFLQDIIFNITEKKTLLSKGHCCIDKVPILIYISLKGKCKHCNNTILIQNPVVELLTAFLLSGFYYYYGLSFVFIKYSIILCILILVAFIDIKTQEIPDELIIIGLIAGLFACMALNFKAAIITGIFGFLAGGILFLLIAILTKGSMGGGDIKLMAMLGLWFGWQYIVLISLFSFIIGSIASIFLIIFGIKGKKDYIPFGPFIAAACLIVMLYGKNILAWYITINK